MVALCKFSPSTLPEQAHPERDCADPFQFLMWLILTCPFLQLHVVQILDHNSSNTLPKPRPGSLH